MDTLAIVVIISEERAVGPFPSGEAATHWAFANLDHPDWYWLPLDKPDEDEANG